MPLYSPIIKWLKKYSRTPNSISKFEFDFELLNSSSEKQIAKILMILKKMASRNQVQVKWYYEAGNSIIYETGMNFRSLFHLDFEFIEKENV